MEIYKTRPLIISWFAWHFFQMPGFLVLVWKNYLVFCADFFSIPLLLKTLLSPWRKYRWSYPKSIDLGAYASNFIFNTFSRLMGLICRTTLIILGIMAQVLVIIIGAAGILFWILLPFISLALIFALLYV
ncbi:MAG TPA: hypothetical protein VI937_02450 [Negativicutes bacterium]|uniref:Uncharacterized protein n=1 Tax=Candidatus Staskawiczbacteria bacterium RIFCSPHIGHO2_01_FULL_41_41 TaxID=1802203 RepID=A0A1G2HUP6_9BACT|nr:MAG: hypothetical protein A2822_02220 [Candidatus Staskawiczbacteria bacterium RIFCSPHIGHO2_01_FULL_41_41]OGZ69140.1 MAG: hypothetical protein A3C50_01960 [Candidatus Staskawiczbacteria bacterium RIFCSPHIGHO2_02_FULL_43_16]OGZ74432.1 MAG: hypothetical protein A3A12_01530 [Candidatus Staskawiczbacteria bacterium RIFCSPLOWO2_01_FULL_43_17b]HLD70717.1 hypothetical protein [Negativicutes bacterium]